jgi:hypothetical protein
VLSEDFLWEHGEFCDANPLTRVDMIRLNELQAVEYI